MTIVCWDGETLASDSRLTQGTAIMSDTHRKIFPLSGTYLKDKLKYIGMAGCAADWDGVRQELIENGNIDGKYEAEAIIIGERYNYTLEIGCSYLITYEKHVKLAVGSGCYFALSGMSLGLNAKEAVRHTISHCSGCGGEVQY